MKRNIFSIFLLLFCLVMPAFENVYAIPDDQAGTATEVLIDRFVGRLKGIERYFMLETIDDQAISLQKMAALMEYHNDKAPESIPALLAKMNAKDYPYYISSINPKSGFLRLQGKGFEVSVNKTYWNIDKSRKLLGTLVFTCTMVCESNQLSFTLFRGNKVADVNYPVEIPKDLYKPEYFLINRNDTSIFDQDAVGVSVELPEKGFDIVFRLQNMPADRNIFRGNCVKLAWQKKNARFKVEPPVFCP